MAKQEAGASDIFCDGGGVGGGGNVVAGCGCSYSCCCGRGLGWLKGMFLSKVYGLG